MASFQPIHGYIFLALNGIALLAIGYTARRTQLKDSSDYEVAGRRVRWPLISGSLVVTMTWASTLLVAAEAGYSFGWPTVWIYPISGLGVALMVPFWVKIKKAMPQGTTFPEYVRLRFGKATHILALIITLTIQIILLFYLIIGLGYGLTPLFGLPYWQGVVFGGLIIVAFTVLGGLWSSLMTDYFQYIIVWTVVVMAFIFGVLSVGGLGSIYENLMQQGELHGAALLTQDSFYNYFLVYLFGWVVYAVMDQMIWQRMYAISDPKDTGKAIAIAFFTWAFLPAMGTLIGIIGLAGNVQVDAPSEIMAATISAFAPGWLVVLFALLVFNAIASTLGSMLVAVASVITTDIYDAYIGDLTHEKKLKYDQIIVVVAGVGVIIAANFLAQSILGLSIFLAAFFTNLTWPVFVSFLWQKVATKAVFAAMGVGFLMSLTLGTAVNYDMINQIGGVQMAPWVVYMLMFAIEMFILIVGTLISETSAVTIEEVGNRAETDLLLGAEEAPGDD